jgi:hypothetical protein
MEFSLSLWERVRVAERNKNNNSTFVVLTSSLSPALSLKGECG